MVALCPTHRYKVNGEFVEQGGQCFLALLHLGDPGVCRFLLIFPAFLNSTPRPLASSLQFGMNGVGASQSRWMRWWTSCSG